MPSNHSRSRQTDLGFEFPTSNNPWWHQNFSQLVSLPEMFFWPGYRQTNKQTNRQTNFNFVRPSFALRGKRISKSTSPCLKSSGSPIPVKSRCIDCLATSVIQQKRTPDSTSPRLKTLWDPVSVKSQCIGCLVTIVVRGKRTLDSSSSRRITPNTIETYHN